MGRVWQAHLLPEDVFWLVKDPPVVLCFDMFGFFRGTKLPGNHPISLNKLGFHGKYILKGDFQLACVLPR